MRYFSDHELIFYAAFTGIFLYTLNMIKVSVYMAIKNVEVQESLCVCRH